MKICGTLSGFKKEDLDKFGFPVDGFQLQVNKDIFCEGFYGYYGCDLYEGADLFFDVFDAEYCFEDGILHFRATCESVMVDGNENDLPMDGDIVYHLVRNSKVTEVILSGDYIDFQDPLKKEKLRKMKIIGSLVFRVGGSPIHKKTNKVNFY